MTTLDHMMAHLRNYFMHGNIEDPMAEARILVGGIMGLTRTDFITKAEDHIPLEHEIAIHDAAGRRVRGEPVYRILGKRGFYGLELKISDETLDPRPDTEVLVDLVLDLLEGRRNESLDILDLGIGTGAVCLVLLSELPNARGTGTDLAQGALDTAAGNAALNGLASRFGTVRSNWFADLSGRYDVIVSNPPYIRSDVIPTLDREVREHDPMLALDGGTDGLDAYRAIAKGAARFLKPAGLIAVETGFDQKDSVRNIFEQAGFDAVAAAKDYAGNDRAQAFKIKN
ncbi:peptide chain release factor N(5)-glutamine methyltransferase [Rhizobium sp.]